MTLNDLTQDDADLDISIRNISIPRSYYSINNNNNTIAFGTSATITLGNGDYTTTTFATELQTKAAALGITAAYNSTNRHFTFHSGVTGFSVVVPNSQYKYLGLSTGTHIATGTTLFQLESDEVVDLSGTNEINIVTSLQVNSTNTEDGNLNRLVVVYPNCCSRRYDSLYQ